MVEKLTVQQLVQENRELKQRLSEAERSSSPSGPSIASAPVTFTVPSALSNVHPLRLATSSPAVKFSATPDSNIGQLSIEAGGTSRYYGALAHVHILPDEEEYAGQEEPLPSSADGTHVASGPPAVFPFNAHDAAWSAKVLSDARRSLPAYDMIDRWLSLYWQASSWRFECVSREYLEPIVLQVYSDTSDHPETQASQLALIFAIVGLAVRLATVAGFHRDGSWWNLPQKEVDARRRLWWDLLTLERIQAARFGCPTSVTADHYDTARPTDLPTDQFLWWRWEMELFVHEVTSGMTAARSNPDVDAVRRADESMRSLWRRTPPHLRSPIVHHSGTQAGVAATSAAEISDARTLHMQQIRLAFVFDSGLLQLHRSAFAKALRDHPEEPLLSAHRYSVEVTINEASANILALANALFEQDRITTRHTLVNLDLFSSLVPLAALIIRSPKSSLANHALNSLAKGVSLLEVAAQATPCYWYRMLLSRGHRLASRATLRFASRYANASDASQAAQDEDVDAMLGSGTRLREQAVSHSGTPTTAVIPRPVVQNITAATIDSDFDRWLSALTGGFTTSEPPSSVLGDMDTLLFGPAFGQEQNSM
ncbi:hypothetical protein EMMF5_003416 [Cystobasidiomycetes sp. EMM_F5]